MQYSSKRVKFESLFVIIMSDSLFLLKYSSIWLAGDINCDHLAHASIYNFCKKKKLSEQPENHNDLPTANEVGHHSTLGILHLTYYILCS